jgi:hypothetical protein
MNEPTEVTFDGGALRVWTTAAGEQVFAANPLFAAVKAYLEALNGRRATLQEIRAYLDDRARQDEPIPDSIVQEAIELDAAQRASGYVGP